MSKVQSLDYIVTAKHYGGSAKGYIRKMQRDIHSQRGIAVTIKGIDEKPTGTPVKARIWQGQWIADCECNGAAFVDPDEPIFFCFSCANRANGQKPRPVIFPEEAERKEIERLLLERPVNDMAGLTDNERAGLAKPMIWRQAGNAMLPLTRSWEPGETVQDLQEQQAEPLRKWRKDLKNGV